jgi:hypothetical protein
MLAMHVEANLTGLALLTALNSELAKLQNQLISKSFFRHNFFFLGMYVCMYVCMYVFEGT